jgi:hypothetical protein
MTEGITNVAGIEIPSADPFSGGGKVRDRISLRIDLPHAALCGDIGIVGQGDGHVGVLLEPYATPEPGRRTRRPSRHRARS